MKRHCSNNTIRAAPAWIRRHRIGRAKIVLQEQLETVLGFTEISHFGAEAWDIVTNIIPIPEEVKQNPPPVPIAHVTTTPASCLNNIMQHIKRTNHANDVQITEI